VEKQRTQQRVTLYICVYYYCSATMNDWDVSGVTDFKELFKDDTTFNKPIDKWNVSSGTSFVSNDQGIHFDSICSPVWSCFQVGLRLKSIIDAWLLMEHALSTKLCFSLFSRGRRKCFLRP
jgi:hypothetical protein